MNWGSTVVLVAALAVVAVAMAGGHHVGVKLGSLALLGVAGGVIVFWRRLYVIARTLRRDLRIISTSKRIKKISNRFESEDASAYSVFERQVKATPDKVCLYFEDEIWTYREMEMYCNRVARAFQAKGLRKGDVVALVMMNRPEYIAIWLGLSQLGIITALVNFHLKDLPLIHTINSANARAVIFGEECAPGILAVRDQLKADKALYQLGGTPSDGVADLGAVLSVQSGSRPTITQHVGFWDTMLYIYTSGTTGLPKAALIPNAKVILLPVGGYFQLRLRPEVDVFYCPLSLYHAAGGVYGVGLSLMYGVPVVIVRKFSASRYWVDCIRHGATATQYIGEMCRYLMAAPETREERQHKVRAALGNGIQPAIFTAFMRRFGIPQLAEFYGSTEGNASIANVDNTPGSIGVLPRCVPARSFPIAIIRVDKDTSEPIRDAHTGLCIRCKEGEHGMLVGKIVPLDTSRVFLGYLDREATEKKILRDVFDIGDEYFLTGDLMVMDELGYVYFQDRTGDTFRWRGENVSTLEVETVVTNVILGTGIKSVAVYGVEVPGYEGRVGMLTIADPERRADLRHLAVALTERLSPFARPLFLRLTDTMPLTGTLKVSKTSLKREAFDLRVVTDPIYMFETSTETFEPLTEDRLADLTSGKMRL